jgi:hypothetical protein
MTHYLVFAIILKGSCFTGWVSKVSAPLNRSRWIFLMMGRGEKREGL